MENNEIKNSFRSGNIKGLGFGLLLVAIGVIFLAANAGLITTPLKWVLISWPMLIIVIGVAKIIKRDYFSAATLLIIGLFFLAPKVFRAFPESFPGMDGSFTHTYWPLLLIAAGIMLVLSKLFGKQWGFNTVDNTHYCKSGSYKSGGYTGPVGSFEKNAIFGGGEHIVLEPEFKGGEINAIFGGLTLDLRHTNLPEGTSRLELNAVFGGVTVVVPNDWFVETSIDAIFGGFEDKRLAKLPLNTERRLVITGTCVFGGGELRN